MPDVYGDLSGAMLRKDDHAPLRIILVWSQAFETLDRPALPSTAAVPREGAGFVVPRGREVPEEPRLEITGPVGEPESLIQHDRGLGTRAGGNEGGAGGERNQAGSPAASTAKESVHGGSARAGRPAARPDLAAVIHDAKTDTVGH